MQAELYSRPADAFRFKFSGVHITSAPDSIPPDKYAYAQNVRGYREDSTRTRPPVVNQFNAGAFPGPVTALEPTLQIRKAGNTLFNGNTNLGTGYDSVFGSSLIPFRPNQSPQSWEYVFDRIQSNKVLGSQFGSVIQKIGIAEPQAPVDATPQPANLSWPQLVYTNGGTAGGLSTGMRVTDTVVSVFPDPEEPSSLNSIETGTSSTLAYSRGMVLEIGASFTNTVKVIDIFSYNGSPVQVAGVFYYAGIIGRCVVVPAALSRIPGTGDTSIYSDAIISSIRRGAVIQWSGNGEKCLVTGVSVGPDGSIAFETTTTSQHSAIETITFRPIIVVSGFMSQSAGASIFVPSTFGSISIGIGYITAPVASSPFLYGIKMAQPDDLFHISIKIDNLDNLVEGKVLIDVGSGDFVSNVYVWSFRANDIQAGIDNLTSQLGIAQLVLQRELIDEQYPSESANQGKTKSSYQTATGSNQWSELSVPLSQFTRVGSDQRLTLANANAIRVLWNVSGTVVMAIVTPDINGGFEPDVTATGIPYMYRIRPRSSLTGAKGNPSPEMRYAVSPRRQAVNIPLPTVAYDPQFDTWDIFRMGGSADQYVLLGSISVGISAFLDNYSDPTIANAQVLEEDNYEPFPSVIAPLTSGSANVIGHTITAVLTGGSGTNLANLLPGNIIQVNQKFFTLWTRPTVFGLGPGGLSTLWLLQIVENAGVMNGGILTIAEPLSANQLLNTVWGPDVNGVLFAVNDPNRPGYVNYTKPFNPDASSDNATELSPPTEPLIGGCLTDGTSIVFSTKRAWRGYPGTDPDGNLTYNWLEIPVAEGAVCGIGAIASDGQDTYYIARDGIRKIGERFPITDADLYNIFPHEGIFPSDYTYAGNTIYAPNYILKDQFRLGIINKFLYFDYRDSGGSPRTLVCNLLTGAWVQDVYSISPATMHAGTTGAIESNQISLIQQLWIGGLDGGLYTEVPESLQVAGMGESVAVILATREEVAGDVRASKQFGDADINLLLNIPAGNLTVTPYTLGKPSPGTAATNIPFSATPSRQSYNVSLNGGQLLYSLGLVFQWTDQGTISTLYSWQPSYISKPENIFTRYTDWDDSGDPRNKYYQGFILEADTYDAVKVVNVRSAEDFTIKGTFNVQHGQQMEKAYTFTPPFQAHEVRLEPDPSTSTLPMRIFGAVKWIFEPTPEISVLWQTQPTAHEVEGYQHIRQVLLTYASTVAVTLTVTVDGVTTFSIVFPSTGGQYLKVSVDCPPNKGFIYQYALASASTGFQVWDDDLEIQVKPWGDTGDYKRMKVLGSTMGNRATV